MSDSLQHNAKRPALALHLLALWTLYRVIAARAPITAQCGEDVILGCTFPMLELTASQQVNITWKMQRANGADLLVHSCCFGTEKQAQAYKGRTQLNPEGVSKGDASLRLRDVRIQDEGLYRCYVNSELGRWSEETSLTVLSARSVWIYLALPFLLSLVMVIMIIKHHLSVGWKLRRSKYSFVYDAEWTDRHLSDDSKDKYDAMETRVQPETHLFWDLIVDDCKQNPVLDFRQLPAGSERHAREKSEQPSFGHGNAPAREKLPRKGSRNPRKKDQWLRLEDQWQSFDGDRADSWTDKFSSEARDLSAVDSAWQEDVGSSQNAMHHVAILGQTGAGKSSFINTIRGLGDEEKGAAKTGVVETTMVPTSYRLPKHPNVTIWDLPGFGRTEHRSATDLDLTNVSQYSAFLIFSSHHFTAAHAGLARKIQRAGKKVYFVRTKVDRELFAARKHRPSTYNEEQILQRIRDTCVKSLQAEGVTSPRVFLLSSFEYGRHDFPDLEKILQQGFGSRFPG